MHWVQNQMILCIGYGWNAMKWIWQILKDDISIILLNFCLNLKEFKKH